ncbi:MAG: FtsX-like permease family protein [Candidatus Omnitrophica bacterium]|nr:FtsX-like permease family protein [Candidatus Omnitrophota bacterium]
MRTEFYLARRYLFRGKTKHVSFIGIVSCAGVMLGVASVIVATSIINGIDGGLLERVMRFQYHVTVESEEDSLLYSVNEAVRDWPGIEISSLAVQTQIFAKFQENIVPLIVKGIDLTNEREREFFAQYVREDRGGEGFFIGTGLRRRFMPGETVTFYPLQKKLQQREADVRGTFHVGLYDIDNFYLITDVETAKRISPHYQFFLGLRIEEPFAADEIKARIQGAFSRGVYVSTWMETNEALFATLRLEKIAMFIILTLIILIASFNIFATLTVKVVEKTKDIGILKSLGFTNGHIWRIFTLQGMILGMLGVIGGSALGLGACALLQKYPFIRLPEEIFFTEYLPVIVRYEDVAMTAFIALGISFVSSIFPALRASRLPASRALRYE